MSRGAPRRASLPFVSQSTEVDCGAACLVMALAARGTTFHLHEVREAVGVGRDGVNAADICDGARQLGFRARAARIEIDTLALLPSGTILHWELRHFVVFEAITREGGAVIVDPAVGRRRVSARELDRALTGIAILIEPGESIATAKEMRRPTRSFLWSIVTGSPEAAKILVASVALQVLAGLFPILSASVVDRVVPRHDVDVLSVLALGLTVLTVFFGAFSLLRGYLLANLRTRVDFAGAARLLEHLVSLPLPYFQERSAGDLMVRVRSNEVLREALSTSMLASVLDGSLVAIYLCALVWILPPVALVVAGLTIVNAIVYLAFRRRHKELVAEAQHRQGVADGHLIDTITGIETLKVAGAEGRATTKWTSLYVDVLNASLKKARLATWSEGVGGTIRMAGPFVVLLVGARGVLAGDISLGTLLSALALAQGIIVSSGELLGNLSQLDTMSALVSRVDDVLLAEPEQPEPRPIAPILTGRIALRGVGYKPSARARHIVREVSLDVPRGALVALVGESGSGKSTLASLLAGLVAPTEGEVTYDGVPIEAMDLPSLRRQMGVVVQRTQVFGSSIRDNITMLEDFPLSEIEEAARLACIHDDISAMGMRYQTPLVAGGAVSGGQRQRIALARALIRKPKVLLLDEATSALDAITERRIFDNIGHMGCTRIVVAHRLSTILEADLIVVMKEGKVVETGRHAQLVERDGVYAKLVLAQTDIDRDASEPLRRSA